MMNRFKLPLVLVSVLGLAACENENTFTRTSQTPMIVEASDIPVTLYRTEQRIEHGGPCGFDSFPGRPSTPRTCLVTVKVKIRDEKLALRIRLPEGSELTGSQTEKVKGVFTNEGEAGFVTLKIDSRFHRYDNEATKKLPVAYGVVNEISVRLK